MKSWKPVYLGSKGGTGRDLAGAREQRSRRGHGMVARWVRLADVGETPAF